MKKRMVFCLLVLALVCVFVMASAETGWTKEGDHLCYYQNGVKLTGTSKIDGNVFNFTDDGFLKGNGEVQEVNKALYFLDENNTLKYGWQTVSGNKYYFDLKTGKAYRGGYYRPPKIDGVQYLFNQNGELIINGWWAYYPSSSPASYTDDQGRPITGYQKIDGVYYLFDENGYSLSGWHEINDEPHFFTNVRLAPGEGFPEVRGWVQDMSDSKWYYFDPDDGHKVVNTTKVIDGRTYSFSETGALIITEKTMIIVNGKKYAIGTEGQKLRNWITFDGNTYYFGRDTYEDSDGSACTGLLTLFDNGKQLVYYFSDEGVMQTNYLYEGEKGFYYFGEDGKRVKGWQEIDGETYYFSPEMLTGEKEIRSENDERYFYYFSEDGILQKNTFVESDGKKYYYGPEGYRVTGWQAIDGATYYFVEKYSQMIKKEEEESAATYYDRHQMLSDGSYLLTKDNVEKYYMFDKDGKLYDHKMIHHEEVPAAVGKAGTEEYWECAECGKLYADAEGIKRITEPKVIPALPDSLKLDADGIWRHYVDGVFVRKTGLVKYNNNEFYVIDGVLASDAYGLYKFNGDYRLIAGGMFLKDYEGLYEDRELGWTLIRNGYLSNGYTGIWDDPAIGMWFVRNGYIDFAYTGLYHDTNLSWCLISGGTVANHYIGLWNDPNYGWWLIDHGHLAKDYNGLWNDPNYGWWLIKDGTIDFGYTGLYEDPVYGWWLIGGGQLCTDYVGLWNDPNLGWWLIDHGSLASYYTGLWNDPQYGWWLVGGGHLCDDYNGLWNDPALGWWLINNGTINFGYTGPHDEFGTTWNIVSGQLVF